MAITVARIFNTHGRRMHPTDGRVLSNFIFQALKCGPVDLYGDGTQIRLFCNVDDLIEDFVRLLHMPVDFTVLVNLDNPGEFTMIEGAETTGALTGLSSEQIHKPTPTNDPKQRRPDICLAKEAMPWEVEVSLEESLKPTIAYFGHLLSSKI